MIEQVRNLAKTKIIQEAWNKGQEIEVHGWVYGLNSGLITELNAVHNEKDDIEQIYRYHFDK